jgi:transcriptional regulator with XRE-family HTH domain
MVLTAIQCRAARGLLGWSQTDLGQTARVDIKTITKFERGERAPHPRTIEALTKALEDGGVEFLDPVDGVSGPGVRLKWEVYQAQFAQGATGTSLADSGPVQEAEAWDDGIEALHDATIPPAIDPEIGELRAYWRANPEKWAAMHKSTRWALLDEMELRQL